MTQNDTIRLSLPADLKYLNVLGACIAAILERVEGLIDPGIIIDNIQLAVQETASNIVRHAYANRPNNQFEVVFSLEPSLHRFVIDMYDTGQSFNPGDVPEPNLNEPPEGGVGLFLIKQLMNEVSYQADTTGNHWRLVKNL